MSKSPSLRRIQADIRELARDPSDRYHAAPLENDMFEWHFTIRGADDTDFAGGVYHGRIMLPAEYPFKPPHIIFLTPSGRFETNTKVCLSFSAYHPELWQPAWGIRLILEALISFLPTPADGAIGALDWTSVERKRLAKASVNFACPSCGCKAIALLPELKPKPTGTSVAEGEGAAGQKKKSSLFEKEIAKLQEWQNMEHGGDKEGGDTYKKDNGDKEERTAGDDNTKEPALAEEKPASSDVNTAGTTTGTATTKKDNDNASSQKEPATTELDRLCQEDPEKIRRELLQGAMPCSLEGEEERIEFEKRRTRQYYAKKLEKGQKIATDNNHGQRTAEVPVQTEQQQQNHDGHNQVHLEQAPPIAQEQVPVMQQQQQQQQQGEALSWMVDPILHGIVASLAIISFLLLRKLQAMMKELDELNQVLEG